MVTEHITYGGDAAEDVEIFGECLTSPLLLSALVVLDCKAQLIHRSERDHPAWCGLMFECRD